jgi:UDP-glucose 4-epimerase
MQRTALVTGGFGFLGRAVARAFRQRGLRVVGIGHGVWTPDEARAHGFDAWTCADVSLPALSGLGERFDVVAHCAGSGSVGYSLTHPHEAFRMTVQSTADLLEHVRRINPQARVIYPSSAAVYGAADDRPLVESDRPNPVSPYGYHKKIVEDLLECHARHFDGRVAIVRFFSIYGPGLAKQLLWDASARLTTGAPEVTFWGTGAETRDWIHVNDAASLIATLAERPEPLLVVNGAGGERVTVANVLRMLSEALGVDVALRFNGRVKPGDPLYYHADMRRASSLGWQPSVPLARGLDDYVRWLRTLPPAGDST